MSPMELSARVMQFIALQHQILSIEGLTISTKILCAMGNSPSVYFSAISAACCSQEIHLHMHLICMRKKREEWSACGFFCQSQSEELLCNWNVLVFLQYLPVFH